MFYFEVVPLNYLGDDISSLTYESREDYQVGQIVLIPLRNKSALGVVVAEVKKPTFTTKEIKGVAENTPVLSQEYLKLAEWISKYYGSSLARVFSTMVPKTINRTRRNKINEQIISSISETKITLTPDQKRVLDDIKKTSDNKPHLLFGVTGSGKTEIYLRLIDEALAHNKEVIYLVPEVSLIPQTYAILASRYENKVVILHSYLKETERDQSWKEVADGTKKIILGSRSALFAPCQNLGLIIIDEEHETSYKQDQSPKYHAVKVAKKITELTGAYLILGSATPNIESYYEAECGNYHLHLLSKRIIQDHLPTISVVDMRDEFKKKNYSIFSEELQEEIKKTINAKKQVLLFLNRRGMSTFVSCRDCGYVATCPNCDISLTFHFNNLALVCHHCGYKTTAPASCPDCKGMAIKFFGSGTQRVEQELKKIVGDTVKIGRMDKDTTLKRGSHELLFNSFADNKIDILIGTQMVSKGWDLPNVELVGIISADTMINFPDYTAPERTFDLLTQVAGRTGRGFRPGKVVLQTYSPNHYAITAAAKHDFIKFYETEIGFRKEMNYPPFCKLIKIMYNNVVQKQAEKTILDFTDTIAKRFDGVEILGPSPAFLPRIAQKYRMVVILKITSKDEAEFVKIVEELKSLFDKDWSMDVDPITTL